MVKYDYYERSAMTTLKEKISVKFEVNEYYLEDESTAYELSTGPVGYRNGYREANYQLKSEVLPILLELALEVEWCLDNCDFIQYEYVGEYPAGGMHPYPFNPKKLEQAIERLRKWSERK